MNTSDTKSLGLSLNNWEYAYTRNPRPIDEVTVPNFWADFFTQTVDGEVWSMGRFYFHETELYRAWGRKEDLHCSYHMLLHEVEIVRTGCPCVALEKTDSGYTLHLQGNTLHYVNLY